MRFDLDPATPQLSYKLLAACVTPRPIAWVSTLSTGGIINAAPYSFFNAMGHTPPTVAIGILADPEKGWKDTARNILDTGEFVVNLVTEEMGEAMNLTCMNAPSEVSEMPIAGLQSAPSTHIKPPRIAGAPVSFECTTHTVVTTSPQQAIVIGQVQAIHVADQFVLDAEKCYIDAPAMNLIGRTHGSGWYTRTTDQFQMTRPDYDEWAAANDTEE
ncbi:Flavin reductase [Sulfitobacter noctilucicola]|uniref:Flavin reductase (DIM6/NTAB) family NADH-FMN oxidoreductase RutF n=1 Tax=Sulfitobacter noctilucicola TaxID=1342301 RepID=A0A7W6MBN9_9RHOB|nr:flavin reductase family protein [Sulfitobacter noctilucicola]KIN70016.1 Flavin reductase [Sulfitobacter noctilucicola]MBB4176029.1 flavin reductase (DIM6/NTAB) family NADH-FMN oxidoreductase RutF [Sulfitobacter noctilucicola]